MASSTEVPADPQTLLDPIAAEHRRALERRVAMGISRPGGHDATPWALAFSGGGIRSATFCLGVLQGLAQSDAASDGQGVAPANVLPQFDYLSTVSGGGFIGSFFSSLFRPNRLNRQQPLDDKDTARQAYQVFKEDPPGRMHGAVKFDAACPGRAPLAWLRENGRYMAPTGSGDMVYATAVAMRNWCAMHYVLGVTLLAGCLSLAFSHAFVVHWHDVSAWSNAIFRYEVKLLAAVLAEQSTIWWSPAWWLILPLLVLWLLPAGAAYWMTHPPLGHDVSSPPTRYSKVSVCAAIAGFLFMAYAWFGERALGVEWKALARALAAIGFVTVAGVVWHAITCSLGLPTISAQRVLLTRCLAKAFVVVGALAVFAVVHTVAQTLYVHAGSIQSSLFGSAASVTALVWVVRRLAAAFEEKDRKGWLAHIPFEAVVTIAGGALFFLVALFWALVVLWIQWHGDPPRLSVLENSQEHLVVVQVLGVMFLLVLELSIVLGRFPGFLNLSTLQGLYGARLTRAYMGASNGMRFDPRPEFQRLRSVAEPHKDDHMTMDQLYENPYAPMHIINVCVNQNIDPAEQLVQRDRKGRPLAIVPSGFALDGTHYAMPQEAGAGALTTRLTVGEWIGVSGAAFSTGMGREGGIGRSLLLGLANVRLGRWWQSGIPTERPGPEPWLRRTFKTQTYLLDELFAKFYGTRRPLQYLSDGGHFENMALYELVRPQRGVRLTVACDCGCDPQYQFADLANLIRLARIDFGTEIEVDCKIAEDEVLGKVFGTPEQFLPDCKDEHAQSKCAMLLNVYHSDDAYRAKQPNAQIILIKPRVTPDACADIEQYQDTHTDFPQQPTADQFYDEAQWESYRKLGLEITKTVFGAGPDGGAYRDALWSWVLNVELATGKFVLGNTDYSAATSDGDNP